MHVSVPFLIECVFVMISFVWFLRVCVCMFVML